MMVKINIEKVGQSLKYVVFDHIKKLLFIFYFPWWLPE